MKKVIMSADKASTLIKTGVLTWKRGKGALRPRTSGAHMKALYETTLEWVFIRLNSFSFSRNLMMFYDFSRHVCCDIIAVTSLCDGNILLIQFTSTIVSSCGVLCNIFD